MPFKASFIWFGLAWSFFQLLLLGYLGVAQQWFPASPDEICEGGFCFCEAYQEGLIKQPFSVWSDLAFIIAGMMILVLASRLRPDAPNPMAGSEPIYPLLLGLVVIYLGPASMVFHASIKAWARWFDDTSIAVWMLFCLSYSLTRIFRWTTFHFVLAFVLSVGFVGAQRWFFPQIGLGAVTVLGISLGGLELFLVSRSRAGKPLRGVHRDGRLLAIQLLIYALAMAIWIPSGGLSRLWCPGESWLQPHFLWHILGAIVTYMSYPYYSSERRTD